jgi:hypothetical protein
MQSRIRCENDYEFKWVVVLKALVVIYFETFSAFLWGDRKTSVKN